MMAPRSLILVAALLSLGCQPRLISSKPFPIHEIGSEANKGALLHSALQDVRLVTENNEHDLVVSLQSGEGIEFIEPVARSQFYNDPVFEKWQERCPWLEFNRVSDGKDWYDLKSQEKYQEILPHYAPAIAQRWGLGDFFAKTGRIPAPTVLGTRNFRLYEVDVSHPPDGKKEILFFSDAPYLYWDHRGQLGEVEEFSSPQDEKRNWNELIAPEAIKPEQILPQTYVTMISFLDLNECRVMSSAWLSDYGITEQNPRQLAVAYGWDVAGDRHQNPFPDGFFSLVRHGENVRLLYTTSLYPSKDGRPSYDVRVLDFRIENSTSSLQGSAGLMLGEVGVFE